MPADRDEAVNRAASRRHRFYRGKLEMNPKCWIGGLEDFALWYTPGVAAPCREIHARPEESFALTNRGNTVAVVTDGTRVLGLGNIGPRAALPVMEGKALLFKYLGGVDAVPLCLETRDAAEIVRTVRLLAPSFGGINLEDIEAPKCFAILDELRGALEIPVWHDDQQGTATVILAGIENALRLVGKPLDRARFTLAGAGAAGACTVRLLEAAGADPEKMLLCDTRGILGAHRQDLRREDNPIKYDLSRRTNAGGKQGGLPEALAAADVLIALSRPGPGTIKPEWVRRMAPGAIVFALANPVPEIWPEEALAAGARVVATGRSDFPNQANNSLGFPGIFRGALDVQARTISDGMCLAAAEALAAGARRAGLTERRILPAMDDREVMVEEAVAVGGQAIAEGVARRELPPAELGALARAAIGAARARLAALQEAGLIAPPPAGD